MLSFVRIQDIADILIMTFLLYQLYSWFRRTRAMQVLLGLGVMVLIYFATRSLGLYMTSWILQELGTVLIVLIIVVFQSEIRQALYRFSLLQHFFASQKEPGRTDFQDVSETIFELAKQKTGVLLVFQRSESLSDLMLNGVRLDCEITPQMLVSIFSNGAPLHDGAALIRDGRIATASCHLPLSTNPELPQFLGTRHRAALGLSERTDAVVVAVSEERGEVSLAVAGELLIMLSPVQLMARLEELVNPVREPVKRSFVRPLFQNLLPKAAILLIVATFWGLITSRQGQITTAVAPVRMHGIPNDLVLVRSAPEEVDVQLKSLSALAPLPSRLDIAVDVDLSGIREGQSSVRIKSSDLNLPSGMVVSSVNPSAIRVVAERKMRKSVPVRITLRGRLPRGVTEKALVAEPAMVMVEGPASQVARVEMVATEEIDAGKLARGKEYGKSLLPPLKMVSVLRDEPVVIKISGGRKKQYN